MKLQEYREYVLGKLVELERKVEMLGALNLRDINIDCENFYRDLLNLLYELNLENSNFTKTNHDTFDLHDKTARQVYQVTSSVSREKVIKTIKQFEEKYSFDYDELYMLFLKKKSLLEAPKRKTITAFTSDFGFSVDRHLLDNGDIIRQFDNLGIDKKIEVYELVRKYFEGSLKTAETNGKHDYETLSKIPRQVIVNKFHQASHHLLDYIDSFYGVPDSHIKRKETAELLNWIKTPISPEEKPVALLVGDAGRGKTVILKDLFLELQSTSIPALGLKADRYYAESLTELEQKVYLEDSFEKMIRSLTASGETAVVLIDQIDALSQSLSAKRQYIDSYNLLVRKLMVIPNVRIILSVRSYDLNYDTDLSFYKNQRIFSVALLEPNQVLTILGKLGVRREEVPKKLLELLQTPHHLNVFCKVYRSDFKLSSINTLHDLYNKLWNQRVTEVLSQSEATRAKLQDLLFAIAKRMYQEQRISTLGEAFSDDYWSELEYLKSNEILLETDQQLQFFHQTFFDFAFAKQFVAGDNSILEYLQDNHQGLFVRSSVKMILVFLREQNHPKYIQTLKKLLLSKRYRFHIKIMTLNLLGYIESPSIDEKNFIRTKVLNSGLSRPFFESVNSGGWLEFLIHEGEIANLLNPRQTGLVSRIAERTWRKIWSRTEVTENTEPLQNLCFQILQRHLPKNRDLICRFLSGTCGFQEREAFVFRILYLIKEWDVEEAFTLFEKYKAGAQQDRFSYYKILEDILPYNFDFVVDEYRAVFRKKLEEVNEPFHNPQINHDDEELFRKMFQSNATKAFRYFLEVLAKLGEWPFIFFDYSDTTSGRSHGHDLILTLLLSHVRQQASRSPDWFKNFFKDHKVSDFSPHQMMIIEGLRSNPKLFLKETLDFLKRWTSSEKIDLPDGKVQHFVRKLLGEAYPLLSSSQNEELDGNLLNISPKAEKEVFIREEKRHHRLDWYGYTQFLYLSALPQDKVFAQTYLKKRFLELQRKFDKIEDHEPNSFVARGVSAPLNQNSYENMSLDNWIATFKKYDESYTPDFGSFKGSLLEHSRAFETEVERKPTFFTPLIERLIDENTVHPKYITAGLLGLQKAKIDPNELQRLFLKATSLGFNREHTLCLVWVTSYFIQTKAIDESTLDFLIDLALHHPDPEERAIQNDVLMDGANNVRGAATSRIVDTYFNSEFETKVFNALEKIANDPHISVKVAIIHRLAYLLHLNERKALNLFLKLVHYGEPEILRYSGRSAQYFANKYFKELTPYFRKMIKIEVANEDTATILAVQWVTGKDEAYPLLRQLVLKSAKAITKAVEVSVRNLQSDDEETIKRCRKLYSMFLSSGNDEVARAYNIEFLHFPKNMFEREYALLKKFSISVVCKKQPNYYLGYLLKCAKKHPLMCLQLLNEVPSYEKPDISKSGYYDDEPIKILLGAYNSLNSLTPKPANHLETTMKLFDKLLKNERFRPSAYKAIELVDR
jgi:hypothetical protein